MVDWIRHEDSAVFPGRQGHADGYVDSLQTDEAVGGRYRLLAQDMSLIVDHADTTSRRRSSQNFHWTRLRGFLRRNRRSSSTRRRTCHRLQCRRRHRLRHRPRSSWGVQAHKGLWERRRSRSSGLADHFPISPNGSMEKSLADTTLNKLTAGVSSEDQAGMGKEALGHIGKLSKPSLFSSFRGDSASLHPPPGMTPSGSRNLWLPCCRSYRALARQSGGDCPPGGRARECPDPGAGLHELYHAQQINDAYMATTLKVYLDAIAAMQPPATASGSEYRYATVDDGKSQLDKIEGDARRHADGTGHGADRLSCESFT